MISTFITIKPHLAEYAQMVFAVEGENYIQIPHNHDLYHIIANFMQKRPENCPILDGNLQIALPARSRGKDALTYNYISLRAAEIIGDKLECLFWAHAHSFIDDLHHLHGEQMNNAAYMFMNKFKIKSISEDAIVKNYYRWRSNVRKKRRKRGYTIIDK